MQSWPAAHSRDRPRPPPPAAGPGPDIDRPCGLRVSEEQEIAGLDQTYWDTPNFGDEVLAAPDTGQAAADRVTAENKRESSEVIHA